MKSLLRKRKWLAALVLALVMIRPAKAGVADILSFLNSITSTLKDVIATSLNEIQTITNARAQLQQQVVWPLNVVNNTKNFVGQIRNQANGVAAQIQNTSVQSATLGTPRQLESLLRGQLVSNLTNISSSYSSLYQAVPQASAATINQRNLMDVSDALAVGSLKTAVISDQAGQQMLAVADNLEQQTASSAPGSAPLLSAQAMVASLQSQAFLQHMLAAELRQDAGTLAHSNALLKSSAQATKDLTDHMQQVLTRQ